MSHFYEAMNDGAIVPRHFTEMASRPGDLRPTRITDVKKWWKEGRTVAPSVTTILNVLDKPGLVKWQIDRHLDMAFDAAHKIEMGRDAWLAEVRRLTENEMDKAPSAGTDLHKSLEDYALGNLSDEHDDYGLCRKVFRRIADETGLEQHQWNPERNFVHPMGFGGQVDLSCSQWVVDHKTKQTADKFKPGKMAYDEHRMQLAAYRVGLGLDRSWARAANVFICLETGEVDFHEHSKEELERGWQMFEHALAIWNLQNRRAA